MVAFAGWDMPLSYPSGTIAEHLACRTDTAIFDVSHLGTVEVRDPGAQGRIQETFTNDLARVSPGQAQYTHLLDPDDGSVLDDLIVWWQPDGKLVLVPNAANTQLVAAAVGGVDVTAGRALLAVQGPKARSRLAQVVPEAAAVGRMEVAPFEWSGVSCVVAGTGYTGEDGVECSVPAAAAGSFWEAVVAAGAQPAGLGARDTLRLEAGFPLHGHELGPGITPLQAGLGWVVGWNKGEFRGRSALEQERRDGVRRRLRGLVLADRRPPRTGCAVLVAGEKAGAVTSGNFSPVLGRGIALAFLPPAVENGSPVVVDVRGQALPAEVTRTPFVAAAAS